MRPFFSRVLSLVRRRTLDRELAEEMDVHLELATKELVARGLPPAEARRAALRRFGGQTQVAEAYRERGGFSFLESVWRDVRHGGRLLLKSPGFTATAIAILALGIGANAAIFSLVNAVVLRPLPYPEPSRLVRVWHTPPQEQFRGRPTFAVSPANYLDWRAQSTTFEHMAMYGFRGAVSTGRGEPEVFIGAAVTEEYFQVLGAPALVGRLLEPGDADPARAHVVVLHERLWRNRFGGDPAIVGQNIRLNGEPYTVVGVLAARLTLEPDFELWMPLAWTPQERAVRGNHNYLVIGRLRRDANLQQAQAELTTISQRLEQLYPADDKGWGALVRPLHDDMVQDVRPALLMLLGAVACVLLIACANLANLLLARALGRAREIAVRTAIGANRGRIVQQLLIESTMLSMAGGIVGVIAATWTIGAIVQSFGAMLPGAFDVVVDARVLMVTAFAALATGIVSGVAPAWRMTRGDAGDALKQGMGRAGTHTGERRVRNVLVSAEVALALMLLVGAGLLIRTLGQLRAVDVGIDPRNILALRLGAGRTTAGGPEAAARFFADVIRQIKTVPGVESAAAIDSVPLTGGSTQPIAIEGEPARPLSEQPELAVRRIAAGYLATVRMRVVAGRDFNEGDVIGRPLVAVVSASAARRFWPNDSPIGKHVTLGLMSNDPREVVGVVSDVKVRALNDDDTQAVYVPIGQIPGPFNTIVVRTRVEPRALLPSISRAIHDIDPDQPIRGPQTLDEVIGESINQQRFAMRLLTGFAALALLLAAIGIYGVLSYTVRQRVQEIGVRMALGAAATDVVRMVVSEGLRPTTVGLAIGVLGSMAFGRVLSTLVFGVTPRDAVTFGAVIVIVLVVGAVACLLPAYRATRVDPLQALRAE